MLNKIKIKLIKSSIGRPKNQKKVLSALKLNRLNKVIILNDTASVRGMIFKIKHLLYIENINMNI